MLPETTTSPFEAHAAGHDGLRLARVLSLVVAIIIAAASAAGLFVEGLYEDADSVAAMFRGYDLVTLVIVAPLLAVTSIPAVGNRPRAGLVWIGMLAYSVYNYALYVFGAEFNAAFLLHVAVFTGSMYALVLALIHVDAGEVARRFGPGTPVRPVAAVLLLLAVSLGAMWISSSIDLAITGDVPEEGSQLILPTSLTHLAYVLDLSLLVPAYSIAAVLLWRRRPWGLVLGAMLLLSGTLHQVSYMVALVFQASEDIPGATAFDPFEPFIAAVYLVAAAVLLAGTGRRQRGARDPG